MINTFMAVDDYKCQPKKKALVKFCEWTLDTLWYFLDFEPSFWLSSQVSWIFLGHWTWTRQSQIFHSDTNVEMEQHPNTPWATATRWPQSHSIRSNKRDFSVQSQGLAFPEQTGWILASFVFVLICTDTAVDMIAVSRRSCALLP